MLTTSPSRDWLVAVWLMGIGMACFAFFLPRWHDWNADSRLDLTAAIVNHGTLAIDAYHDNTGDDDFYRGHWYSSKDPGQALAGVPVFLAFKGLVQIGPIGAFVNTLEANSAWKNAVADAAGKAPIGGGSLFPFLLSGRKTHKDFALLQYIESLVTVAAPSALFMGLFFWFLGLYSPSRAWRALLSLALGLSTIVFAYSQQFISHVPAAILLFVGFALVQTLAREGGEPSRLRQFLRDHPSLTAGIAGAALGFAVLFEYYCVLGAVCVAAYAVKKLRRRQVAVLVVAALPALLIVLITNALAYGSPLTTGYGCNEPVFKSQNCQGISGFTLPPKLNALYGLTVSPFRGLFFLSPFLLAGIAGWVVAWRAKVEDRATCVVATAVVVGTLLAISMFGGWSGGSAVGARYLMPLVPFLVFGVVFVLRESRPWVSVLVALLIVASTFEVWIETIGSRNYPSDLIANPLFSYSLPAVTDGNFPLNLGNFVGLAGWNAVLVLPAILVGWSVVCLAAALGHQVHSARLAG